jgi:hypothetical protein
MGVNEQNYAPCTHISFAELSDRGSEENNNNNSSSNNLYT